METLIVPRLRDLGEGFQVRRALPTARRRMVGPFVFFDQMGPAVFTEGQRLDVRPHPHIGLATVTYLFEGAVDHRDSLGTLQTIRPGEVNWMTAGRGIAHSERSPREGRTAGSRLFGIQTWVALPRADEEMDPSFAHFDVKALPVIEDGGVTIRVIAGSLFGSRSPVPVRSPTFYADVTMEPGSVLTLDASYEERAAFVVEGTLDLESATLAEGTMAVFARGGEVLVRASEGARVLLLGGDPMDGPRHIVWNFVSSSADRIEHAKEQWREHRFPKIPGDDDYIPLPEHLPQVVDYP